PKEPPTRLHKIFDITQVINGKSDYRSRYCEIRSGGSSISRWELADPGRDSIDPRRETPTEKQIVENNCRGGPPWPPVFSKTRISRKTGGHGGPPLQLSVTAF